MELPRELPIGLPDVVGAGARALRRGRHTGPWPWPSASGPLTRHSGCGPFPRPLRAARSRCPCCRNRRGVGHPSSSCFARRGREEHQLEPVGDAVEAIFDGDACHPGEAIGKPHARERLAVASAFRRGARLDAPRMVCRSHARMGLLSRLFRASAERDLFAELVEDYRAEIAQAAHLRHHAELRALSAGGDPARALADVEDRHAGWLRDHILGLGGGIPRSRPIRSRAQPVGARGRGAEGGAGEAAAADRARVALGSRGAGRREAAGPDLRRGRRGALEPTTTSSSARTRTRSTRATASADAAGSACAFESLSHRWAPCPNL